MLIKIRILILKTVHTEVRKYNVELQDLKMMVILNNYFGIFSEAQVKPNFMPEIIL